MRRQGGWFPRDPRITWLDWDAPDLVDAALAVAGPDGEGEGQPAGEDRPASPALGD